MLAGSITKKFFIEPNSGCWLWVGSADRNGYGLVVSARAPKKIYAHRYIWEAFNGPIPPGLLALHKCDTPACCNPTHIFLGTQADNMADKVQKGRQSKTPGQRADACVTAKLTWDGVRAIRAASGSNRALARRFSVCHATIASIRRNETWRAAQ